MSRSDADALREVARELEALTRPVARHHVNVLSASAEALVHLPPDAVAEFAARSAAVAQQLDRLRSTLDATSEALSDHLGSETDEHADRYLDVVRHHIAQWSQDQSVEPLERRLDDRRRPSSEAGRDVRADTVELSVPRSRRKVRRPLPEWLGD